MADFRQCKRWLPTGALQWIIVLAILLRVGSAVYQGDKVTPMPGTYDQVSYHALAERVAGGNGFSFAANWWPATRAGEPTAHWSFLYTSYIALIYFIGGVHPLVPRLLQAILCGALQPYLTYRIGARLFGTQLGLTASFLSALYAYFVYYAGSLMTESFYIVAVLWALDTTLRLDDPSQSRSRWRWVEFGLGAGTAALLRQTFIVLIPVLCLWLIWRRQSQPKHAAPRRELFSGMALSVAVMLALITPWVVRNYRAFGLFPVLNTNSGYVLFWANHPIHGNTFIPVLPDNGSAYGELIPDRLRSLNEAALDKELFVLGLREIAADPSRYAALVSSRFSEFFKFWPSRDSAWASNVARTSSFGFLIPFILIGMHAAWGRSRREGADVHVRCDAAYPGMRQFALLVLFISVYSAVHLLTWVLVRYRLPIDAVLVVFAGAGLGKAASLAAVAQRRRLQTVSS